MIETNVIWYFGRRGDNIWIAAALGDIGALEGRLAACRLT